MPSFCVFGASSTWGAWDLAQGGWVNRLRLWIDEQNLNNDRKDFYWETYNLGVSGDTTKDLLARFDSEVRARKPQIIIFSIGDNDAAYENRSNNHLIPIKQFTANVQQLIRLSNNFTARLLFLGLKRVDEKKTTPIPWRNSIFYTNDNLQTYDQQLELTVKKSTKEYLKMYNLLNDNELSDGLHPNEQGHEKIFHKVSDFLESKNWLNKLVQNPAS